MDRNTTASAGVASGYRLEGLKYLQAKVRAWRKRVDEVEILSNRAELMVSVLEDLWRDAHFLIQLERCGLTQAPAALYSDAHESTAVKGSASARLIRVWWRTSPSDEVLDNPSSGAALLAANGAPERAYAILHKVKRSRQKVVADLMIGCSDYTSKFIAALLAATPEDQRSLVIKLGTRGLALQEELAAEEQALRDLSAREREALSYLPMEAFQLCLADCYVRRLLDEPTLGQWLIGHRPQVADALKHYAATTQRLLVSE